MPPRASDGRFFACADPDASLLETLAALDPTNPFITPGFVRYRAGSGGRVTPWVVGVDTGTQLLSGCIGYLHRDVLPWSNMLEIHSFEARCMLWPGFWEALLRFCQQQKVKKLSIQSFGSAPVSLPSGPVRVDHRTRHEYVMSLTDFPGLDALASNHRRNAKRAERKGIVFGLPTGTSAARTHASLMGLSDSRRRSRGEAMGSGDASNTIERLLEAAAGQVFQAREGGTVLSSILVLRAREGAYYHSAGTSPEGMQTGASHLLISRVAEHFRDEGFKVFNLGGADSEGLVRFKQGFGATEVSLEAATYFTGNWLSGAMDRMKGRVKRGLGTSSSIV